ncbi:MAG: type II toxin-antitoxin system prevent-host-death family antitoxin [Thermoleophilia bacterium]|nr:type II toxin-antitoxin system prevent-host-death family antitoxin [Thermoleophilia bacterium]
MVVRAFSQPPPEDIPQRELRNDSSRVLREVDAGKRFRITVAGRPVAELGPVPRRQRSVPGPLGAEIIRRARARVDPTFWYDVRAAHLDSRRDAWERYGRPNS